MPLAKWHPGKLIILWSWGALLAALALTSFLATPVAASPAGHLVAFLIALLILLALSIVTWKWLSGRESGRPNRFSERVPSPSQPPVRDDERL